MLEGNDLSKFLPKKAYEISYALFRVASVSKKRSFAEHIERQALSFLASVVREDYTVVREAAKAMEYLLSLGENLGIVNAGNAQTIIAEITQFNAAIAELGNQAIADAIDLSNVFSEKPQESVPQKESQNMYNGQIESDTNAAPTALKSGMRQSAILERIRQYGNCHLKEIQEGFPDTSERTVRYDLQSLLERGLVERIGNGGPATFYRAKQEVG